MESVVRTRE